MTNKNSFIQAEGFFPSEGRWLFYRCFYLATPDGKKQTPKGEIIAIHGAAEHCGRYYELASEMSKQGYNFYSFDLTGHGRSEGRRGYIEHYEDYLVDIANFYAFLKIHKNMKTPYLFGHSAGGLLSSLFTVWGKCELKGLILSAPLFKLKVSVPIYKKLASQIMATIYPSFSLKTELKPEALTHDDDIIKEYITDPMILQTVNARWFNEMMKAMKKANVISPFISMPCILFHGSKDQVTDYDASKKFFNNLASKDKDLYVIRDFYHEVFNEVGREQVYQKLITWLNKRNEITT